MGGIYAVWWTSDWHLSQILSKISNTNALNTKIHMKAKHKYKYGWHLYILMVIKLASLSSSLQDFKYKYMEYKSSSNSNTQIQLWVASIQSVGAFFLWRWWWWWLISDWHLSPKFSFRLQILLWIPLILHSSSNWSGISRDLEMGDNFGFVIGSKQWRDSSTALCWNKNLFKGPLE